MYTNRFISLFIAISLLAVVVLATRNAEATPSIGANVDSATRSYTAWAKAAEVSSVDSATRSYIAQAKAVTCSVEPAHGLDSATQSYISWARSLETRALCQ